MVVSEYLDRDPVSTGCMRLTYRQAVDSVALDLAHHVAHLVHVGGYKGAWARWSQQQVPEGIRGGSYRETVESASNPLRHWSLCT